MDKLVSISNGVIIGSGFGFITVRFTNHGDLIIDFPDILFNKDIRRYGQSVSYEIWERLDGTRYDTFSARQDNKKNPYLDKVEDLLNKIKLKDEL